MSLAMNIILSVLHRNRLVNASSPKTYMYRFLFLIPDVIDAFNTTSRYLDDILNINNVYLENMVS